ncbi:MAG: alpha/beta hydrolase, partial [Pseudomonadota bacterium]
SYWSHLAAGPLARGWAVALPSYTLAPAARISEITREIGAAIEVAAARVEGPIRLTGHSAGGHLASRMVCEDAPLAPEVAARVERVVSISGLHDLRPLLKTEMNADFRLDQAEAAAESPALLAPRPGARVTCWVGADERPEFVRQNALLANVWSGLGADMDAHEAPGEHHFNVIDGLADPNAPLCKALCG